jgi:hypothetical protein
MWRIDQGYPIGHHKGTERGSRLAMPWAQQSLANYLTDTIRDVVRAEVLDPQRSRGKLFSRPRIFNDLLSSQPLCFNLFAELQQDLPLATSVFQTLTAGRVREVTAISFEHSPGRRSLAYTNDNSAFDVFITYTTAQQGTGFIGIEVKYHENLKDPVARHRERYDEIAAVMGCFRSDAWEQLKAAPLQQIWRDHLLAGSTRHTDRYDDGFFAFVYPQDNTHCAKAIATYRACLADEQTLAVWTLEDISAAIRQHSTASWIDRFYERYLDFERVQRAEQELRSPHHQFLQPVAES